jgi:hypothetical protein
MSMAGSHGSKTKLRTKTNRMALISTKAKR